MKTPDSDFASKLFGGVLKGKGSDSKREYIGPKVVKHARDRTLIDQMGGVVHERFMMGLSKQGGEEDASPGQGEPGNAGPPPPSETENATPSWDEIRERAAAVVPHRMTASDVVGAEEVLEDMAKRAEAEGHAEAAAIYRGAIVVVKLTEGKARMRQWKGDEEGAAQILGNGIAKVEHMMVQAAALVGGNGATEEGKKPAPEGGEPEE